MQWGGTTTIVTGVGSPSYVPPSFRPTRGRSGAFEAALDPPADPADDPAR